MSIITISESYSLLLVIRCNGITILSGLWALNNTSLRRSLQQQQPNFGTPQRLRDSIPVLVLVPSHRTYRYHLDLSSSRPTVQRNGIKQTWKKITDIHRTTPKTFSLLSSLFSLFSFLFSPLFPFARLASALLGSARLCSARLGFTRLGSARHGSARHG